MPRVPPEQSTSRVEGGSVLAAAVVSGVAGYGVLLLTARMLPAESNAQFLVFWGALFSIFGVLIGITTETTRAVLVAGPDAAGPAVVPHTTMLGLGLVVVAGLSGPWWAPRLFESEWRLLLAALLVGTALFVVHAGIAGAVGGRRMWGAYSTLVGVEAATRLVLVVVATLLATGLVGFAWAAAASAGAWVLLALASPRLRGAWHTRVAVGRRGLSLRVGASCVAAGASALLLVGYPVLLKATTSDAVFDGAAPILLAVSLSRAPLLVPLGAYQNVAVAKVVRHGIRALVPVWTALAAVCAVGSGAAWLVGPWLLRLINADYHVSGPVFAALVVAAGLVALLTLTGAATVAVDAHAVYLGGWIGATVVSLVVLTLPGTLEHRVLASLFAGPVVGVLLHLGLARSRLARSTAPHPATSRGHA